MSNSKYSTLINHITRILDANIENDKREMDRKIDQEFDARQDFENYKKAREIRSQWDEFVESYDDHED